MWKRIFCIATGAVFTALSTLLLFVSRGADWADIALRVMGGVILPLGLYVLFVGLVGSKERVDLTAKWVARGL